jgi:alpha-tubulin suppressor-like RCC1 family protein
MSDILCTSSLSAPLPALATPALRLNWLTLGAALILMATLGCREDAQLPSDPEPGPALTLVSSAPLSFLQVSTGVSHTCGVTADHRAFCWGQNDVGQLGDGTTRNDSTPVAVAGGLRFLQVSAGVSYSCGVTTDNRAYCWGGNTFGRLGNGTTTSSLRPVAVSGGYRFRLVSAADLHTCGVALSDRALCWGSNRYGQVGDGSMVTVRKAPVLVAGSLRFRMVSAGGAGDRGHSCGVTFDERGVCWGYGGAGELGDGTTGQRRLPRLVLGGLHFREVIAGIGPGGGYGSSCGVTTVDRAYCWGANGRGQLGDGTTTTRLTPVAVSGGLRFSRVSTGFEQTCGVTTGNRAYCWGYDYYGQLGDGGPTGGADHLTPVAVAGGLLFSGVVTGQGHSCGVTTASRAYCWGADNAGQLGDGSSTTTSTPVAVVGPM